MKLEEIKELYANMKDPGEISVGYVRSYEKLYSWLTLPLEEKGLGVSPEYATKLLAVVAHKIKHGELVFKKTHQLDSYLRNEAAYHKRHIIEQTEEAIQRTITEDIERLIYDKSFRKALKAFRKGEKKRTKKTAKQAKKKLRETKKTAKKQSTASRLPG